jgi:hypothetical protein
MAQEELHMFGETTLALAFVCAASVAVAKDTQFWNLTANTITSFELSPAGANTWGKNQTDNDSDHSVDHDERLKVTGVAACAYDARFTDKAGRTCIARNLPVKLGTIFSIEEKSLSGCTKVK